MKNRIFRYENFLNEDEHPSVEVAGIGKVRLFTEMNDYHSGQSYMVSYAVGPDDEELGHCDWSEYNKEISIDMMEVKEKYRRKGIATLLMNTIKETNPGQKINYGYSTDDGTKWLQKYNI